MSGPADFSLDEFVDERIAYRRIDRFVSAEILARGEPDVTQARILVFQAAAIAMTCAFSALYQFGSGTPKLGIISVAMTLAALAAPLALARARSHVWVSVMLTGSLFTALSIANFVTAGHAIASAIFITTVPLVATLTQGARLGAAWGLLTLAELVLLGLMRGWGIAPWIVPNPNATEWAHLRGAILVTLLVTATGVLHAYFNEHASRSVTDTRNRLARNRVSYREMLDNSPDGFLSLSAGTGRVEFVNLTLCRMLGLHSRRDIIGRAIGDVLVDADFAALAERADRSGEQETVECEALHADGTRLPFEVAASRIYVRGDERLAFRLRDIRRFRDANREAHVLRSTFDQAPIGVAVMRMDSEVLYTNDAYLDLTGFSREQLVGRRLLDLSRGDESHDFVRSVQHALERGETISVPKMEWHRFNAPPGYVDVRSFTVHPPGEREPRWVAFIRDVTPVVELEREVSRAERIDSLGKLAGGIAHDFNNLLTVIMGQVDILDEDLGQDHWGKEALSTIMDACDRSAALTSKVLDFSRKQALRPSVFMADEAIRGMVPLLRQLVPERIALDLGLAPDNDPRIRCDSSRFEQILLNLVANARDAIEGQGTIVLRVRTHPPKPEHVESLGEVEIEVSDDGAGMTQEIQDRIFEPFFTTKAVGEGTGLGLSTVHGIVHQSGGRLEVSSREGQGTALRVFFPATNAEITPTRDAEVRRVVPIDGERGSVLVVEDHPTVRALVTQAIERLGFDVVTARDGMEARDWIEDHDHAFDALVSDIVMPNVSGVEVARLFRARFARRRIVLMSGYAEDEIGPIEQLPSDIRFVQKPVTAKTLGEALA